MHAVFAVTLRADQIVAGTAINFLALGITGFLFVKIYGTQGTPDDLPQIPDVSLPIEWIPFLGDALAHLNLLIWVGLIAAALLSIFLFRTRGGLRMRSVGENPLAADTAGISPIRVRYWAVIASGAFAALGGVFLSIGFVHSFNQNMTVGKGFIGLAVVIVGKWKPGGAVAAALLFGFSSALAQRLAVTSPSIATLLQALPYVITLIAVAGLVGRSRPPAADGIPYERVGSDDDGRPPTPRPRLLARERPAAAGGAAGVRRGRALPPHVHDAAALQRRDAAAGARAVAPVDDVQPALPRRLGGARPGRLPVLDPPPARRGRRRRA